MLQSDRPRPTEPSYSKIRLFLDTADTAQWQSWLPIGMFYGVTTNPLLLERAQRHCSVELLKDLAQQAFNLGAQEVQLQTWGTSVEASEKIGNRLAAIDDRVVVKIPVTQVGTAAAARLLAQGIRVTLTGVYAVHQVLIAAALGTDYAAPYLGRIIDLGRNGREELATMQRAMAGVDSTTRILVASIRSVEDIVFLTTQGLNTFTFSPAIAAAFFDVDETNRAATEFEEAAQRLGSDS